MDYQETTQSKKKRIRTGWIILPIGLALLWVGITLTDDPYFGSTYRLAGIGLGGLIVLGAIHGLFSKPVLTLDESGIRIRGYLIPTSNMDLKWAEISSSRVTKSAANRRFLWLTKSDGKFKLIEETRYEDFQGIVDFTQKKLAERGIVLSL